MNANENNEPATDLPGADWDCAQRRAMNANEMHCRCAFAAGERVRMVGRGDVRCSVIAEFEELQARLRGSARGHDQPACAVVQAGLHLQVRFCDSKRVHFGWKIRSR